MQHRRILPQYLTTLDAYLTHGGPTCNKELFQRLNDEAARFKQLENRMIFLNSTGQGGGVALMRHGNIRLFDLLQCQVDWHVLTAKHKIFNITKIKFHNMLQGVAPKDVVLNDHDKVLLENWSRENADLLFPVLKKAKVIVCDDYQPSGLIPIIREINPEAKVVYRSHIHIFSSLIEEKGSPQAVTWDYIWEHNRVKDIDLLVSHPIAEFVPRMVPRNKVILVPASTNPLDGLNKPLTEDQLKYYILLFNNFILSRGQKPLDIKRPYIIQTARFDPSKGIPDVLESFRRLRRRLEHAQYPMEKIPQLVIVGHGSIDDPESEPIMASLEILISLDIFDNCRDDIKRARMPHNDQVLNALLRCSHVALQLSHREGFEVKVSESLLKGKPIIIYNAGGMPLQVKDGINAFIVPVGNTHQVAEHLFQLFTDEELYKRMSKAASDTVSSDYFSVKNCLDWLFIANELVQKGKLETDMSDINDLLKNVSHP